MSSPSLIPLLCVFIFAFSHVSAQSFYVAAPNTIRLEAEATVAVAHDEPNSQKVNLFLQDYPGRKNRFSYLEFDVIPGRSEIVRIRVTEQDFPDAVFTAPGARNYVALVVQSGTFNKEVIIPVSSKSGYVFVQTDKPIYTPKQTVNIQVIRLTEAMLPSEVVIKLQIRNPQNVIVKEEIFSRVRDAARKVFLRHVYTFPPDPLLGEWTVSALYGPQFQHNSSVKFEVREYVLPRFVLRLQTPDVILPDSEEIRVTVTAEYVYKKKIEGHATFKFGVKDEMGNIVYLRRTSSIELEDGVADSRVSTNELQNHQGIGWFPEISGNTFVVEAIVTDFASGNQEVIVNQNGIFSESPFVISFKRCLKDFKPGFISVVEADIIYVNRKPAPGVQIVISAVADAEHPLEIYTPQTVSDEEGRVTFLIHSEFHHSFIEVTLRTNDTRLRGNQAVATHIQQKFISAANEYLVIQRRSVRTLTPLSIFSAEIFTNSPEITDIYYMAVSRGAILLMNKLPKGSFRVRRAEFMVIYGMVPSFRFVVFAHFRNEIIADSLKVYVTNQCSPAAEVTLDSVFPNREPGSEGKIVIRGPKDTLVGLLAVDEAIYSLRNNDLLTREKMFKTMESHDLGCGPGGGRTTTIVMGNAGVVLMTNLFTPPLDLLAVPACDENVRRKREIVPEISNIAQNYNAKGQECCSLGLTNHHSNLNCFDRATIVQRLELDSSTGNCTAAFLECCMRNNGTVSTTKNELSASVNPERISGNFIGELDFIEIKDEEDIERNIIARRDFRETWFFDERIIGPDYRDELHVSLPHSFTAWVIQAVSVSIQYGMCVTEPHSVVAFKNVFLQLNFPYSVVRNEQVEIQAVVFNYGPNRLAVVVYMYGVSDICSGFHENEKSERKKIYVDAQSAHSVSFPIIPLKTGEYNIKVVALSPGGSDAVTKKLNVVPEGYTVESNILVKLDPTRQQKRGRTKTETDSLVSDSIDRSRNLQTTAIQLSVPDNFIPGTASCVISVVAEKFGPTMETAFQDPEELIRTLFDSGLYSATHWAVAVYTMRYLIATGQMTRENEAKGYDYIRKGYQRVLSYQMNDGSFFGVSARKGGSVRLTVFVTKAFCQASELVNITEGTMCSRLRWLMNNQEHDGSQNMTFQGGVKQTLPMTAYVQIALQECSCDFQQLRRVKVRAETFLESWLVELTEPLSIAIVAYALHQSDSMLKDVAFGKLQSIEKYDHDMNTLHWENDRGIQDIEVTSYGLLTYLRRNDMIKSSSIVNWLNRKRYTANSFSEIQKTVIALQALSEYAIAARARRINYLVSNITSNKDRHLQKTFVFHEDNALVQQHLKIDEVGGLLFVSTEGQGSGLLTVKLKYNVPTPPEEQCKFDIKINVTEVKGEPEPQQPVRGGGNNIAVVTDNPDNPDNPIRSVDVGQQSALGGSKTENKPENNALVLNLQICVRYLGESPAGMVIVDAGIFSGFEPNKKDLDDLMNSNDHFIDKYKLTSRGVVIYLETTPIQDYCFAFRVNRLFIAGNTQKAAVRVYDYNRREESCIQFYSSDHNSPMLRTTCSKGICQCAESGCPPKNPFARLMQKIADDSKIPTEKILAARNQIEEMICDETDYAWKGMPTEIRKSGGFLRIRFLIDSVLKEGTEKRIDLVGETRELIAKDNCETAELFLRQSYLIMGKDGEQYMDDEENLWNRYILDRHTSIHKWTDIRSGTDEFLQNALNFVNRKLSDGECFD